MDKLFIYAAIAEIFGQNVEKIEFQETRKDFEGDLTLVVFPLLKVLRGNPAVIGEQIGAYLEANSDLVTGYNVVKGFLNLVISDDFYLNFFKEIQGLDRFGWTDEDTSSLLPLLLARLTLLPFGLLLALEIEGGADKFLYLSLSCFGLCVATSILLTLAARLSRRTSKGVGARAGEAATTGFSWDAAFSTLAALTSSLSAVNMPM